MRKSINFRVQPPVEVVPVGGEAGVEVVTVLGSGIRSVLCFPGITWESSGRREVTNFTLLLPLPWLGTFIRHRGSREREDTVSWQAYWSLRGDAEMGSSWSLVLTAQVSRRQLMYLTSSPLQIENAKKTGVLVSTNQGYHSVPGQVSQQKDRNYF